MGDGDEADPASPNTHPAVKWALGVLATVVASVIGFFLIGPNGLLNHKKPDLSLSSLNITGNHRVMKLGDRSRASIVLSNDGEGTARRCGVRWEFELLGKSVDEIYSRDFNVPPGKSVTTRLSSEPYPKTGPYYETVTGDCSNTRPVSDLRVVVVATRRIPNRHVREGK
jgi:hypothetical protein